MNPSLDMLIGSFRRAQDVAVATLTGKLGIPRPASNRDWLRVCAEHRLYQIKELEGVQICAHGYGIELIIGDLTIDFDWGENGEPDGFDAWRLWIHAEESCRNVDCTEASVQEWLDSATRDGELVKVGKLYFDPRRRAIGCGKRSEQT